jgi:hypothetical protein
MKRAFFVLALALAVANPIVAGQKSGRGKPEKAAKHAKVEEHRSPTGAAVRFSTDDAVFIREYYGPRYKALPHGLQKKVARGEPLPPGWQKKMQPFPIALERRLGPLPSDYGRGVIDGHAVIYNLRSHSVIDVTVAF